MVSNRDAASCCSSVEIGGEIEEIRTCLIEDNPSKAKDAANNEREDEETFATAASNVELGTSEFLY